MTREELSLEARRIAKSWYDTPKAQEALAVVITGRFSRFVTEPEPPDVADWDAAPGMQTPQFPHAPCVKTALEMVAKAWELCLNEHALFDECLKRVAKQFEAR